MERRAGREVSTVRGREIACCVKGREAVYRRDIEGAIMGTWQSRKPPNERVVEVKNGPDIIRVRAIWGRDGVLPHWESEDRNRLWGPSAFKQWRHVRASTD